MLLKELRKIYPQHSQVKASLKIQMQGEWGVFCKHCKTSDIQDFFDQNYEN